MSKLILKTEFREVVAFDMSFFFDMCLNSLVCVSPAILQLLLPTDLSWTNLLQIPF